MRLRAGDGDWVVPQLDTPNQLAFPEDLPVGGDFGQRLPLQFFAEAPYFRWKKHRSGDGGAGKGRQTAVAQTESTLLSRAARDVKAGDWVFTQSLKHASSAMFPILAARHCALVDGGSSNRNMFVKK